MNYVSNNRRKRNKLKDQTGKGDICKKLIAYEIQETIMAYYSIRNTITYIDGLMFKDQLLIEPKTLRKEAHAAGSRWYWCL